MYDGDAVVTALMREAETDERLAVGIRGMFRGKMPESWIATAAEYAAVKDLPALAQKLRSRAKAA